MTTATSTEAAPPADLPPGYYVEAESGAWVTLSWPGDPALQWNHPDRLRLLPPSLAPDILRWCAGRPTPKIPGVDGVRLQHHLSGQPWRFTAGQLQFLHLWYALRPDGRWLHRSGVKRGAKGTGKDPLAAAIALIEAQGPVVLEDWDGVRPVGRPHVLALVQIGANSEAQAKDLLRVANWMIAPELRLERGADDGITRTQFIGGSRIELLTLSEKTAEGDPSTAILLNETQHMTESSGGQNLAAVARRNVGKSPGGLARLLELGNAPQQGDGSVATDAFEAWQLQVAGKTRRQDILYDSREAPAHLSMHVEVELEAGIAAAYSDAPWVDQERIRDDAQDPRVPPATSEQFYFNRIPVATEGWVVPRNWDALARPDLVVADKDPIAAFLDCSKSEDATTLAASRIGDGHVLAIEAWQRPHGDRGKGWLVPRELVDARVRWLVSTYDVQWLGVDPSPARDDETEHQYWASLVDEWHRDFRDGVLLWATPGKVNGNAVLFDMRLSTPGGRERMRLFTEAAEQTAADIDEHQALTHDGDPMMRMHVHNARRRPNQWGVSLGKQSRDSKKLVDYAVSMVGARMGRRLVLNSGLKRKKRSGVVW